ncbi:hypothetical protein GHT06_012216 [Daphnia sinensis]|uniref:HAUS augmin-like complex subunit 6 N-terminal domain-containing protein n=1 Tax=Daphnia sinensis TaxID=1820382 RepID=A0AAD5LFY3_9CRUS|nr:hypothetical protein GHT06_012216 [Daphnia sinensis]
MASNISAASCDASTPVENEVTIELDYYNTLFVYLRLLKFDNKSMSEKHKIKFDKDLFRVPNQKAFQLVIHFLFNKLDGSRSKEVFRDVWPITDKKQEAEFRKKVRLWLAEVQENNKDAFQFDGRHINPSMFLSPGGEKFAQLMCALASHILNKIPVRNPPLEPAPVFNSNPLITHLKLQVIKGHLHSEFEANIKITNSFQEEYQYYKQLARELQSEYRALCEEELRAKKELCLIAESSALPEAKKKALIDLDNNEICLELASEIEKENENLNTLMKELLIHEESFKKSWNIIKDVIEMTKGRQACLNGRKLISSFPTDYIEQYQTIHSGSGLELQKKGGYYDLVPLLNLVLFSVTTAKEITEKLSFPSLEDELMKLSRLQLSAESRTEVANQLGARWSQIFNEQTEAIDKMLTSKFQGNMPMALQSVTPFRNVLIPDKNSAEATTPAVLREALGMTPVEMGAKAKMRLNQLNSGRPSLDLLNRRPARDGRRRKSGQNGNGSVGRPIFEMPELRMLDKRRSQEMNSSGLELCRKRSLTPDPSRNSSLNRTPVGTFFLPPHTRMNRPSSLAASPVVALAAGSQLQKQQTERRSLIQIAQQLEAAAISTPQTTYGGSVWDQAAENIVFDLVRFDSPAAPAHGFIDPNSSYEQRAFVSRNLIQRSPEQMDGESRVDSNLDLLKVLETKFISPRRSSLLSRPGSRNSSPLPQDWMDAGGLVLDCEKGLLDASSASLIDDLLDYSQGL